MDTERLKRNKLSVLALRLISPRYGHCLICGLPWNHCVSKNIDITESEGVMGTCDYCWNNSTKEEVINAYENLWEKWDKDSSIPYLNFNRKEFFETINREYDESHKKYRIDTFIEVTPENKDIVFHNQRRNREEMLLELENDEYNYGHNVPTHHSDD